MNVTPEIIDKAYEAFEKTVDDVLGDAIRENPDGRGAELWSALANIIWVSPEGVEVAYSFRSAGGLVADLVGAGDYMRWYGSGPYETVADWIAEAMFEAGWRWKRYPKKEGDLA